MSADETVTITIPVALAELLRRQAAPLLGHEPDGLAEALVTHAALSDPSTLNQITTEAALAGTVAGAVAALIWANPSVVIGHDEANPDDPTGPVGWTATVASATPARRVLGVGPVADVRRLLVAQGVGLAPRAGNHAELN